MYDLQTIYLNVQNNYLFERSRALFFFEALIHHKGVMFIAGLIIAEMAGEEAMSCRCGGLPRKIEGKFLYLALVPFLETQIVNK